MPDYKLTYFNGRGRAEIIRLIFAAAGVQYEDIRVDGQTWSTIKPTTPFGQLPMLEIDGVKYCQSNSIARYLARKFDLAGKDEVEQLQSDMIIDCMEDAIKPMVIFMYETDEIRKAEGKKKFSEEQLPASYAGLENLLKSNGGGDGYFVGSGLTWADLALLNTDEWAKLHGNCDLLNKYPKLKALHYRVQKLSNVAAWLITRPLTER